MRTHDCEPTLTDFDVLDFCRLGYLMLERVVPNEVNERTCEFLDAGRSTEELLDELAEHVDSDAVTAYRDYFDSIRNHGMEPMVTLNHYTLPLWLHDGKACHNDFENCEDRGWDDAERLTEMLGLYSGFAAREFGDQIEIWLTLNEPFAVILAGYLSPGADRTNPPGVAEPAVAISMIETMIEAHAAMYDAVHAEDPEAQVGAAPNLVAATPNDPDDELDQTGAMHLDYVYNRAFLRYFCFSSYGFNCSFPFTKMFPTLIFPSSFFSPAFIGSAFGRAGRALTTFFFFFGALTTFGFALTTFGFLSSALRALGSPPNLSPFARSQDPRLFSSDFFAA